MKFATIMMSMLMAGVLAHAQGAAMEAAPEKKEASESHHKKEKHGKHHKAKKEKKEEKMEEKK
jgi:prophage tail gpP-like protein